MLEDVAAKGGFKLNFKEALIGGAALDAKDDPFPDESLKAYVLRVCAFFCVLGFVFLFLFYF